MESIFEKVINISEIMKKVDDILKKNSLTDDEDIRLDTLISGKAGVYKHKELLEAFNKNVPEEFEAQLEASEALMMEIQTFLDEKLKEHLTLDSGIFVYESCNDGDIIITISII